MLHVTFQRSPIELWSKRHIYRFLCVCLTHSNSAQTFIVSSIIILSSAKKNLYKQKCALDHRYGIKIYRHGVSLAGAKPSMLISSNNYRSTITVPVCTARSKDRLTGINGPVNCRGGIKNKELGLWLDVVY